ncbi:MAG: hypothetical protein HRU11_00255 [Parvularculaceae bacterium]|nr:hypothetical protein [Parvularculaceae bacterium]
MKQLKETALTLLKPFQIVDEDRGVQRNADTVRDDMTNSLTKMLAMGCAATVVAFGAAHAANAAPKRVDVTKLQGSAIVEYAAQPYIQFREDIDYVSSNMPESGDAMREAHLRLASHDTKSMAGSWVAYAAMVAADSPAFAAEIEKQVKSKGAKAFAAELESNPGLIRNLKGADQAIASIMTFAASDAGKIRSTGDAYISEAYDMQKVAWARKTIAETGMERIDAALSFAAKREWTNDMQRQVVRTKVGSIRPNLVSYASWSSDWAGEAKAADPAVRPGTIVTKALVLGAHYAMNTATQEHMASFATSRKSERCFTSAKMNLDQCIAATRTPYEEAFCLGQHGLNDMSSCVGWPAGADTSGT